MAFEPIAITGHACVVPGALTPQELWELVAQGRSALGPVPAARWRVAASGLMISAQEAIKGREGTVTNQGGLVSGFERLFDPGGFKLDAALISRLDPVYQWLLHSGREALSTAGLEHDGSRRERIGAIIGNLCYPSTALAQIAEQAWLGERAPAPLFDPRNRFCSGYPVHLLCRALGLGAGGFALDAACASSLYAIKLACDWLHDGRADAMLAGGINAADLLILHSGFTALNAISPSGRSRPFHRDADGLLPAEGAALVVLRRLTDAVADGDPVLGVIRGIALSNDGRGKGGILAPSETGQQQAMANALALAGLKPRNISLIECHATGTVLGDATEIRSSAAVYNGLHDLPVGSLKSNLGHLTTASGAAGLIKVLLAMQHGVRPPSLNAEPVNEALADSPFRVLHTDEPWTVRGPRRAAVSSFGFGGNNAHLLVEQWRPGRRPKHSTTPPPITRLAVVGIGVQVGEATDADQVRRHYLGNAATAPGTCSIVLEQSVLRLPPRDLAHALAQQPLFFHAALQAVAAAGELPVATGIFAGMGCDADAARHVFRLRLTDLAQADPEVSGVAPLDAAVVVGAMANILANRLNAGFDWQGPGFAVAAEELSGVRALEIATRMLATGEIDAAVVGAVDLCTEPVHAQAARALLPENAQTPGDGACALVLMREADAITSGRTLHALIEPGTDSPADAIGPVVHSRTRARFGHVHAASGLLDILAAIWSVRDGFLPVGTGSTSGPTPWPAPVGRRSITLDCEALGGQQTKVRISEAEQNTALPSLPGCYTPELLVFTGRSLEELRTALAAEQTTQAAHLGDGPRLVLLTDAGNKKQRIDAALAFVDARRRGAQDYPLPQGTVFRERPVAGQVAFVFTGAAAAYRHMGRDLALALPEQMAAVRQRGGAAMEWVTWIYRDDDNPASSFEQLTGSSFLCQLHAECSRLLTLQPDAALGLSSGETNALLALGAWDDMTGLLEDVAASGLYSHLLGGEQQAVRDYWRQHGIDGERWAAAQVLAPRAEVTQMLADEPVRIIIVNSPVDMIIGGEQSALERVVTRLGRQRVILLDMDLAVHCPELEHCAELWRRIHHRPTRQPRGIRFYGNACGGHYPLSADSVAEALTEQALHCVDFPRTVQQAWEDGVRIFIEHGPRGLCSRWISQTLGEREHLAVAYDAIGRPALEQFLQTVAELVAAGLAMDLSGLQRALARSHEPPSAPTGMVFPAHRPPVRLPAPPQPGTQLMPAAPLLAIPDFSRTPPPPTPAQGHMAPPPNTKRVVLAHIERSAEHPVALPAGNAATGVGPLARAHAAVTRTHLDFLQQAVEQQAGLLRVQAQAVATLATAKPVPAKPALTQSSTTPSFDRQQLELLASGRISSVFGPRFAAQDDYQRQVRMPMPPLLLADRVTHLNAQPASMTNGTIHTETDIPADAWYLHHERMPMGIMIEAGQADLLLISWLGVDLHNRGERVYRLLGCELTLHGGLPQPGDTLRYDIHVDGHAKHGAVRLFFFHYDCRIGDTVRLSVRHGQAGFFTDQELTHSEGVLWSPETGEHKPADEARVDPPLVRCTRDRFDAEALRAFSEGRTLECFGPGFELAASHTRPPCLQSGDMLLLREVTHLDPQGGPWGRGYLRAQWPVSPEDWFFEGHFKNDPCMPGTLMFEGCLQAMAFYLAALGYTLHRDGWRFEPVSEETYRLVCRGQISPHARELVYEVFVEEVIAAPRPLLRADLLCTVDGLKAFHCRGMLLQLVPGWPLQERRGQQEHVFDHHSLLACALGRPSEAFGPYYRRFDAGARVPRLPAPPYHFISRIAELDADLGGLAEGAVVAEYDIPADAWYFDSDNTRVMPYCVLLEAALQPCGWLSSYSGFAVSADCELFFRNLDGTAVQHLQITPRSGTLRTRSRLVSVSRTGSMVILGFEVQSRLNDQSVLEMTTAFGFFPAEALADQVGLPVNDAEKIAFDAPVNLHETLSDSASTEPRLAGAPLRMIDRITGFWPQGGTRGLGRARAEKTVNPGEWFFKAHFFQDPVQPGSLGITAMIQLLQWTMLRLGLARGIDNPHFEPIALNRPIVWKYRGQVLPSNRLVTVLLDVLEHGADDAGVFARAEASLWVDGKKIYHMPELAMRIVSRLPEPLVRGYYLEELHAGMSADDTRTVSDADIDAFAAVTGDHNPVHTDEVFAQHTAFKGRIAHGLLAAGFISKVLGTTLPGPGAVYLNQNLRFKAPVKPGERVVTRVSVRTIDQERSVVCFDTECRVGTTTVLEGEAELLVPRRPE